MIDFPLAKCYRDWREARPKNRQPGNLKKKNTASDVATSPSASSTAAERTQKALCGAPRNYNTAQIYYARPTHKHRGGQPARGFQGSKTPGVWRAHCCTNGEQCLFFDITSVKFDLTSWDFEKFNFYFFKNINF